ncbi:hypothetical protein [Mycolicibacterium gilvum]|uniref:hypothetical protein n=1 Tax=Mycolicibacterium gilvum TaxID=1804 RepID=UPI004045826F
MQVHVEATELRKRAVCDCGWRGKRRWLRGVAVVDAHLHAAETSHLPLGARVDEVAEHQSFKGGSRRL